MSSTSAQPPKLRELLELTTKLMLPFYQVERDLMLPIKPRRAENDVEHSWSVAFLACSLAPEIDKRLDLGKIAQFAIVHDVVEVFAGDTSPWHDQATRVSKDEREEKALQHISSNNLPFFRGLPKRFRSMKVRPVPRRATCGRSTR